MRRKEVDDLGAVAHVGEAVGGESSEERRNERLFLEGQHGSRGDAALATEAHAAEGARRRLQRADVRELCVRKALPQRIREAVNVSERALDDVVVEAVLAIHLDSDPPEDGALRDAALPRVLVRVRIRRRVGARAGRTARCANKRSGEQQKRNVRERTRERPNIEGECVSTSA